VVDSGEELQFSRYICTDAFNFVCVHFWVHHPITMLHFSTDQMCMNMQASSCFREK